MQQDLVSNTDTNFLQVEATLYVSYGSNEMVISMLYNILLYVN